MPKMTGPDCPQRSKQSEFDIELILFEPIEVVGQTLGEVLNSYSEQCSVLIEPFDGSDPNFPLSPEDPPKYFFYRNSRNPLDEPVVDIHVERNGKIDLSKAKFGSLMINRSVAGFG